jgi:tetratricopeptide (TPR) repeat protein
MPLSPDDQRCANAAQGYAALGMWADASEELEKISVECRDLPEVQEVRMQIYSGLKEWGLMRAVAKGMAESDPGNVQWWISWAYATRRAASIEAAKVILVDALKRHPGEPMVRYNLACYDCQLGNMDAATEYMEHALRLNPRFRTMALEDEDLRPMWKMLREG